MDQEKASVELFDKYFEDYLNFKNQFRRNPRRKPIRFKRPYDDAEEELFEIMQIQENFTDFVYSTRPRNPIRIYNECYNYKKQKLLQLLEETDMDKVDEIVKFVEHFKEMIKLFNISYVKVGKAIQYWIVAHDQKDLMKHKSMFESPEVTCLFINMEHHPFKTFRLYPIFKRWLTDAEYVWFKHQYDFINFIGFDHLKLPERVKPLGGYDRELKQLFLRNQYPPREDRRKISHKWGVTLRCTEDRLRKMRNYYFENSINLDAEKLSENLLKEIEFTSTNFARRLCGRSSKRREIIPANPINVKKGLPNEKVYCLLSRLDPEDDVDIYNPCTSNKQQEPELCEDYLKHRNKKIKISNGQARMKYLVNYARGRRNYEKRLKLLNNCLDEEQINKENSEKFKEVDSCSDIDDEDDNMIPINQEYYENLPSKRRENSLQDSCLKKDKNVKYNETDLNKTLINKKLPDSFNGSWENDHPCMKINCSTEDLNLSCNEELKTNLNNSNETKKEQSFVNFGKNYQEKNLNDVKNVHKIKECKISPSMKKFKTDKQTDKLQIDKKEINNMDHKDEYKMKNKPQYNQKLLVSVTSLCGGNVKNEKIAKSENILNNSCQKNSSTCYIKNENCSVKTLKNFDHIKVQENTEEKIPDLLSLFS